MREEERETLHLYRSGQRKSAEVLALIAAPVRARVRQHRAGHFAKWSRAARVFSGGRRVIVIASDNNRRVLPDPIDNGGGIGTVVHKIAQDP